MPATHTTRLSASAPITTTSPTASTTSRAARSGQPIQLQQSSSPSPSQAQDQARANSSHGGHSPHRYSSSAAQSPVSPDIGGRTIAEETSPATDSLSPWRSSSTKQNIPPSADADSGETYSTGRISPTHEMAQSQRRMSEHEAALMAGNRSFGAPTPTSTSSYGGAKDEGGYGVTRESEFGGTDDGYGGGMVGAVGLGELGMHGGSASPSYEMDGGDHDGGQEPTGDTGEQDGIDDSEAVRGLFKMRSEGEGQDQEQSGIWTEMKTKAGKERKRLPLACIMCRRKKIRCSGEKPACKHCLRSRIPCVYKQTARKTVPRTDYMTMLDRRLKRLEERLLKSVPKEEISTILANTGRSVVRPAITAAAKKRTAEMAFEDEISSWSRTGPRVKQRTTEGSVSGGPPSLVNSASVDTDDGSHALPSKDIQEHLAEVFFNCVYGQPYFLLHKPSFMRSLRAGTVPVVLVLAICAVSARFSKHPAVRHDPPFLAGENFASEARRLMLKSFDTPNITNLIVCIILGLHEFGTCHGGRSWALGGMATRMAHALQLHKEANQDPMGKVHPLMRPDYNHDGGSMSGYMSFTDKEIRRRCMWACFVMDRFNSSGTERPCIINESELEIQLPVHDRNLQLDAPAITEQLDGGVKGAADLSEEERVAKAAEGMGIGAYMVRAVAIYGRVVKYLSRGAKEKDACEIWDQESQFCELNSEIQQFLDDLPEAFHYTPANIQTQHTERTLGQFVFLHVVYQQIRLFLHRSALNMAGSTPSSPTAAMPAEFAESAGEIALDAATKIAEIIQNSQELGVLAVAPFAGYCAFNASLVHLVRMFHRQRKVRLVAKEHMETCLKFLLQLKQYWGLFHSITDNLKTIYRKLSESSAQGAPVSGHQEISRMLQYGDWFLKYPQGYPVGDFDDEPRGFVHGDTQDDALSHRPDLQTADDFFARLGPRLGARQSLPSTTKYPQTFMHASPPDNRSSPASAGHGQSPMNHPASGPPPMQQSTLHASPSPAPTGNPSLGSKQVDRPRKIDTHKASHARRASMSQTSPPLYGAGGPGFVQQNTAASQLASPLSAQLPNISASPPHFTGYPASALAPQSAASSTPSPNYNRNQPQQQPVVAPGQQQQQQQQPVPQAPFLAYDSYLGGTDSGLIAALNSGLWQGFDQPMGTADVNAFQGHYQASSSAWFLPFNSVPPGFETGPTGLDTLEMLAAGGAAGGGEGGDAAETGTAIPEGDSMSSALPGGVLSTAPVYHAGTSGHLQQQQQQQQQRKPR